MPLISATDAPEFDLPGTHFRGLAAPSRGAAENAAWIVTIHPGTTPVYHQMTREETFIAIEGEARAIVGGQRYRVTPGSALVVPPNTEFAIENASSTPFRAVVVLPIGGQAIIGDGPAFTPPWAD
jgi:quercetin dioxygenase-like cupin family protein